MFVYSSIAVDLQSLDILWHSPSKQAALLPQPVPSGRAEGDTQMPHIHTGADVHPFPFPHSILVHASEVQR